MALSRWSPGEGEAQGASRKSVPCRSYCLKDAYDPSMPMLQSCTFPGCNTRTLSTLCLEHEVLTRAQAYRRACTSCGRL